MSSRRRLWSKAKIARVWESVHAGGYVAERSPTGCVVRLSPRQSGGPGGEYLIPLGCLPENPSRWLGRRLVGVMRSWLASLEGTERISGSEAWELRRWCVRWSRPKPLTASAKRRAPAILPPLVHSAGYIAERSRRGWVVRLNSKAGPLSGHYLVPFRAFRGLGREWNGDHLLAMLRTALLETTNARRISDADLTKMTS
jgi:hypothetical protein